MSYVVLKQNAQTHLYLLKYGHTMRAMTPCHPVASEMIDENRGWSEYLEYLGYLRL